MGFKARNVGGDDSGIDWKALNEYMVDTCDLRDGETVVGIISGIVDLGLQEQEDGRKEWEGTTEERDEIENDPDNNNYFEEDGEKIYVRWPNDPRESIAIFVDFPDIIVDKASFFGSDPNPSPLRICMNGSYYNKEFGKVILGRPFPLSVRKNALTNHQWSFPPNTILYKLGLASGVITKGEAFVQKDIINLLGKAMLFNVRVCFNDKGYYKEEVRDPTKLMKGQSVPNYDTSLLFDVGFDGGNSEKSIRFLTAPVINTMELSSEYNTSGVKEEIENRKDFKENKTPEEPKTEEHPLDNDFDPDSIPF